MHIVGICSQRRRLRLLIILLFGAAPLAYAEWTKDIQCPTGTEYRDLRPYAGREEFCERLLPGSLKVKHGPYRFWVNPDFPETRGTYTNGRQTGTWRDCDKNGHCKRVEYPLLYPQEKDRTGVKPEIPITYHKGKYLYDFTSCWSTWVTQSGATDTEFNIGGSGSRCTISYFPPNLTSDDIEKSVNCWVPYSVGIRELTSLDLIRELPKLGLPQFCQHQRRTGTALTISDRHFMDIAYDFDVTCAAIETAPNGGKVFIFRLNSYITELANQRSASDGPMITRVCMGPSMPVEDQATEMIHEIGGETLFRWHFSSDAALARRQEKCLQKSFRLKTSCR